MREVMGMKEKKKDRGALERICRRFDIPCDVLPGGSLVTVRGRGQVTVGGSRRILEYTKERIRIGLSSGQVVICGRELECISYGVGQISAEGIIDSVSFSEEDF
jgi:sporulation protein YqfC